jgi:hypothetical protein
MEVNKQSIRVGVFVRSPVIRELRRQNATYSLKSLHRAGHRAGLDVFFFSAKEVDVKNQTIRAMSYNEAQDIWQESIYPYPHVLYNRRAEGKNDPQVQAFRREAKRWGTKSLNPVNDFHKWELHQRLCANPHIAPHLPATRHCNDFSDIEAMLRDYPCIYLKAVTGRYSRYVMRVGKTGQEWHYSYVADRLVRGTTGSEKRLRQVVDGVFDRREILIQQAVDVFSLDGCQVDMRAELQRNGAGDVVIVANSARVGSPGSPVTSTRADAAIFRFSHFLRQQAGLAEQQAQILELQVQSFLTGVYLAVENIYGPFGEMGIDYALDKNYRLWLIECNAKSAKVAMFLSYSPAEYEQAFRNPMEYARLLASRQS